MRAMPAELNGRTRPRSGPCENNTPISSKSPPKIHLTTSSARVRAPMKKLFAAIEESRRASRRLSFNISAWIACFSQDLTWRGWCGDLGAILLLWKAGRIGDRWGFALFCLCLRFMIVFADEEENAPLQRRRLAQWRQARCADHRHLGSEPRPARWCGSGGCTRRRHSGCSTNRSPSLLGRTPGRLVSAAIRQQSTMGRDEFASLMASCKTRKIVQGLAVDAP